MLKEKIVQLSITADIFGGAANSNRAEILIQPHIHVDIDKAHTVWQE